jgi:hypothetical protein
MKSERSAERDKTRSTANIAPATNGARDDHPERVFVFLRSTPGRGCCAPCIATAVELRPKRVNDILLRIERRAGYVRKYAQCAICGKNRIVALRTI